MKRGDRRSSEGLRSFKPSRGTNLLVLIILAGDIEMNPGPRSQCSQCKKYCKATDTVVKCEECRKCFHASCANLSEKELLELGSDNGSWYCKDCKAECGLCSGAVLNDHKAVQCDKCEMRVHIECSFVTDFQKETMQSSSLSLKLKNLTSSIKSSISRLCISKRERLTQQYTCYLVNCLWWRIYTSGFWVRWAVCFAEAQLREKLQNARFYLKTIKAGLSMSTQFCLNTNFQFRLTF